MSRRDSSRATKMLANRLRAEAARSRPAFSEALHGRIWRAVQQYHPAARRRRVPRWALAAVAAAVSLGAAVFFQHLAPRGDGPDVPASSRLADRSAPGVSVFADALDFQVDAYTATGLAASMPNHIDALVDSAVTAQQWAYLDDDAQLTVRMLADRLPFDLASSLTMAEPPAQP